MGGSRSTTQNSSENLKVILGPEYVVISPCVTTCF
jgi:hypothetical protein